MNVHINAGYSHVLLMASANLRIEFEFNEVSH